ncbi:MAG: CDGSH iron-sulfur domain-containing protein [Anaerolineales bacterium]|nr:CDGSH iron-sulfur domain-containing protein [Anaerolineales bacterium]
MSEIAKPHPQKVIVVQRNGPYLVKGGIPLYDKIQVVSEHGEPLTWRKGKTYATGENYLLCRCGKSKTMPFCDGTHGKTGFDGTDTADERPTAERREPFPGGVQIEVSHDDYLCMESGFCGTRWTTIKQLVLLTGEIGARSHVVAMVERCPSGSLTYRLQGGEADIEPDLPQAIAYTADILSTGEIRGAYWVMGGIPILLSDGKPLEVRNRVTLCSCGLSKKKPLCDGAHRTKGGGESAPRPPWEKRPAE